MKDSLFAMLMTLFEKSLAQFREQASLQMEDSTAAVTEDTGPLPSATGQYRYHGTRRDNTIRVITPDEQRKMTRASYQLLMRLQQWGVLTSEAFEQVLDQISFSDSRYVSEQETRWLVRNVLSDCLAPEQLVFLDLLLYQQDDARPLH
ncbi:Protein Smg [Legionella geestiana]|uniref:Protein Smg n=1 Tax=Legionella geestiana TaxID=45065 RepID=A0A0W0U7Z3_9GAMM|nr:DUF494 family protein [Legionella geestiana]KTD03789.1 Protein Smg [Legionella geestiana]QBS11925.1 DUF494 family protein [Legionella geestiana]QDQ40462.1 DUF494 family protein [Legionella geestiana]STX53362.1 Uncharacterized protein conserved in bacteria [Legionella geestiana]